MLEQFAELTFAAKLLSVAGPIFAAIALIFTFRLGEFTWPNIAVIALGMICPLLPTLQKLTVGKDSMSFELAQATSKSSDAIQALEAVVQSNAMAMAALSSRVEQLSVIANKLTPPTADANLKSDLTGISNEAQKITRQSNENLKSLGEVRTKTEALDRFIKRMPF